MNDDELGTLLSGGAIKVHFALGPGLLESVYETCLAHELRKSIPDVGTQVAIPFEYDSIRFEQGLKVDIVLAGRVLVELKAVEKLQPIHSAQLLTYLRLSRLRVGYLLNFNVRQMRDGGIKRLVNG